MNRRAWGLMASLGATAMLGLVASCSSCAADPTPPPSIKRIDATRSVVSVDIFGGAPDIRAAAGVTRCRRQCGNGGDAA